LGAILAYGGTVDRSVARTFYGHRKPYHEGSDEKLKEGPELKRSARPVIAWAAVVLAEGRHHSNGQRNPIGWYRTLIARN